MGSMVFAPMFQALDLTIPRDTPRQPAQPGGLLGRLRG